MKALCVKIWRLLGIDVLFLSLVEKLARGLSKKLTALQIATENSLNRILQKRNAKQAEMDEITDDIACEIFEEILETQAE